MFMYIVQIKSNLCSMYIVMINVKTVKLSASWSSGYAFVSGARSLKFEPWAGETEHTVANR